MFWLPEVVDGIADLALVVGRVQIVSIQLWCFGK